VVALATTALALGLAIRVYEHYGTLDADKLAEML